MDLGEIQNIMAEEMDKQDEQEALLSAYYRIAMKIIKKRFKSAALSDRKAWRTINDATYAKSRLCFFLGLTQQRQDVEPAKVVEAVSLYDIWLEVLGYYYENFEVFAAQLAVPFTKADVAAAKRTIAKKVDEYHDRLEVTTGLSFPLFDFQSMDGIFSFVQQSILGPEVFPAYIEEFNEALAILALYQVKSLKAPANPSVTH